jgi:hypothetical protein
VFLFCLLLLLTPLLLHDVPAADGVSGVPLCLLTLLTPPLLMFLLLLAFLVFLLCLLMLLTPLLLMFLLLLAFLGFLLCLLQCLCC